MNFPSAQSIPDVLPMKFSFPYESLKEGYLTTENTLLKWFESR